MNAKKILVPVTLEEGSGAALAVATTLAQDLAATVVLLYVLEKESDGDKARAEKHLQRLAAKTQPHAPIDCLVTTGEPVEEIVGKCRELGADAIVMSSHGDCGWLSWLHRQTARNVLRRVNCPVWVIFPALSGKVPTLSLFSNRDAREHFPRAGHTANLFPFPASLRILRPQG